MKNRAISSRFNKQLLTVGKLLNKYEHELDPLEEKMTSCVGSFQRCLLSCSDSEILRQDLVLGVNSDKSSSRLKSLTTIGPVETILNAEKAVDDVLMLQTIPCFRIS